MVDKKKQGKKNRKSGAAFELKVRADLSEKGWIVSKWQNNVEFEKEEIKTITGNKITKINSAKLIPARRKFNPFNRALTLGTGFPDFIAYVKGGTAEEGNLYLISGVEAKINGYLDKEEKEKCKWLLEQGIFSKILIARKPKVSTEFMTGEKIIYEEYGN